ncbi:MAG: intein-containing nucleotide sugar dehydrogenase [Litorilinea sp.]|nr:MAG: intein-containing nucleotide sugar dehydrogenase [Litorilinea sp.]
MKNIAVAGTGYVGLSTGTCFADMGNKVTCIDINEEKIEMLRRGEVPIYEPGLSELITRNVKAGRLFFTTDYAEALADAEFVFICVGTPSGVDGEADLRYVRMAAESIAQAMDHPLIVVNKSTVPVGTGDWVADIIQRSQPKPIPFDVVSCPEFTREGSAIYDFMNPDRVVLGSKNPEAAEKVAQLHLPLRTRIVVTDLRTAEMIKYASNAFLATKISFINEIAAICEKLGADVQEVAVGMGYDKRIGPHFLNAGLGYGGSCFEGDETVFSLNSPNVATESFEALFANAGEPFQGDTVQVCTPRDRRVLAFDLETGRPTLAEVKAVTRRPYKGTMVEIKASMGRTLRVTADHPVIVRAGAGLEIVPALAVTPGDQLLALCDLPAVEEITRLDLVQLLAGTELEKDVHVAPTDDSFRAQYTHFAAHIPPEMLRYPYDIRRKNRMPLRLFRHLREKGVLHVPAEKLQLYTAKGAGTRLNAVIPVDADLLRFCGYYLAEGYISCDRGRAGATRERVGLTFHQDEAEYIADVRRILERWGLKFIERRSSNAVTTVVSSRIFAWLLRDVLKLGTRSEDKALPRLAFNVASELRHELLRGAFSGDGAVTAVQNGRNLIFEYATVSKQLADGMVLLMQSLGIVPSVRKRWMNKSKQPAYILRVSGYGQLAALQDVFGARHRAAIGSVLEGYQRHIRQRGFSREGGVATLTVQAVEYEEVETTVYSLETSTGTLVASSGLICHNCFPKDVKALEHMALVQGSHPSLLRAVMEINRDARRWPIVTLRKLLDNNLDQRRIGLLGLAFKPNTDDIRDAPALEIARMLQYEGALVSGYDPVAMANAARENPELCLAEDPYDLARDKDALIICTEWNEFKHLDLARIRDLMARPIIIDGRNIYEVQAMKELGFIYRAVGRGASFENGA